MESSVARPLLALTSSSSSYPAGGVRRRQRRMRLVLLAVGSLVLIGSSYLYFGPSAGLPVPHDYWSPPGWNGAGNAPPPPHGAGTGWHPQPPPPPGALPPFDAPSSSSSYSPQELATLATASLSSFLAHDAPLAASLLAARALYSLKTGRSPPKAYDAFWDFAGERRCVVGAGAYAGVLRDFSPFWKMERERKGWFRQRVTEMAAKLATDSHGVAALTIRSGRAHKPENGATYFDGDWENTINKFAAHLPPMTVLISGRDEPRVVFDVGPLFDLPSPPSSHSSSSSSSSSSSDSSHDLDSSGVYADADAPSTSHSNPGTQDADAAAALAKALTLTDPTPFALSPPDTGAFFSSTDGGRKDVCRPRRGEGRMGDVPFLLSASSAEFTTDLVPVLSMTKLADASASIEDIGGGSCFADILMPGEFYYRNSWWAGKFEYPDNVRWEDKKDVLYWRGKSNGGHIRGNNYLSFPRFRLMDLAALPENKEKGLFDVRIMQWHEWHCTDNCDPTPIRTKYNITDETAPREEAYGYKYLLDVDGNSFSGRYLGLLRSGGLVFKSTAFTEFFTPWLVPYEHFIPVRPDLADLAEKVEWARANDAEAHRIQETGRLFAEQVLTDAQNDCYWFAVLVEWAALWGEEVEE